MAISAIMRYIELPYSNDSDTSLQNALQTIRNFVAQNAQYSFLVDRPDLQRYVLQCIWSTTVDAQATTWLQTAANYTALGFTSPPPTCSWTINIGY